MKRQRTKKLTDVMDSIAKVESLTFNAILVKADVKELDEDLIKKRLALATLDKKRNLVTNNACYETELFGRRQTRG